jgi:two-component system phosphate regulon response regulator PhoB
MSAVLIVEDDPDLLGAVSEGLEAEGWTVLQARSVGEALELTRMHAVDIVLSDLGLADGDGEMLRRALGRDPSTFDVPLVIMTASSVRGRDLDPSTVIRKPFDAVDASAALERALSRQRAGQRPHRRPEREGADGGDAALVQPAK